MEIYANVLGAMGNTPLVEIRRINPNPDVKILAKIESGNPGGSIKDRVALAMIEAAERSGELTPDKTVIEATSGNTGIGLAMVCAVKGYKLRLLMSEFASEERKKIVMAYGAEVQLTPGHLSTDGAIEEAYRLAREEPDKYVLMDQYNNEASIEAHYNGTGREIWEQTDGLVTHVVLTLGTSGTAMGVTKRLKEHNPEVRVVAVEPYAGHAIQGLKNMQESYPPGIYKKASLDRILRVEDAEAFATARRLAREEGIFVGMSSGAAMAAALRLAGELDQGMVVVILPDSGERYLSTPLFAPKRRQGITLRSAGGREPRYLEHGKHGVGLFTPGPPLDALEDLDAWRRIAVLDVLARHMDKAGISARLTVALADMDDRAITAQRASDMDRERFLSTVMHEIATRAAFWGISDKVGFHAAGKSVNAILDMSRKLLLKGAAYERMRSVYFDVLRFASYGRLSSQDLEMLSLGKTVDLANYVKENPQDFTLLKRASLQDLKRMDYLQTEWGNVRPSWFLQQAAVAVENLPKVDVCMVGQTQRFPHLENLRALWALGSRNEPQAWLVCEGVHGADSSKLPAFCEGMERQALRMWLLSASPHKALNLSEESLHMWQRNWSRSQSLAVDLSELLFDAPQDRGKSSLGADVEQQLVHLRTGYKQALEEDLSLHRYWAALFAAGREARKLMQKGEMRPAEALAWRRQLEEHDAVLGFLDQAHMPLARRDWPETVAALTMQRDAARRERDYARADTLRDAIAAAGYRLEDTPNGTRLYPL